MDGLPQPSLHSAEASAYALHSLLNRGVPVSGRHSALAWIGTAQSDTVADMVRHGPTWRGLIWLIEVRGLANRSEGTDQ